MPKTPQDSKNASSSQGSAGTDECGGQHPIIEQARGDLTMPITRRVFMVQCVTAAAVVLTGAAVIDLRAEANPPDRIFEPTMQSLAQYRIPEWFKDAKFGIMMHWGPCSVPGISGWYGRFMYQEGSESYNYHLATYGHPSEFGYKDVCKLFQPSKFDAAQADRLVKLYKRAGARYIVPVAVHHDNFDMWDSTYQPRWNVKATTGKDVVGIWKKAAIDNGLRFGVSTHVARSYRWFQPAHGADTSGPYKGVPYDGQDPAFSDLYGVPYTTDDTNYDQMSDVAPPGWEHHYEKRMLDLIDKYQPDLYYEDGGIPFHVYPAGLNILAHYYNRNIKAHNGKLEAVATIKLDWQPCVAVQDYEGAPADGLAQYSWQSEKALNAEWFWTRHENANNFPNAGKIITTLVDYTSRNGTLLLNVQLAPDGTLSDAIVDILEHVGKSIDILGPAIFGTRPWKIAGEGDGEATPFNVTHDTGLTETDFRFTTKGNVLYAMSFGWPSSGQYTVQSLASGDKALVGNIRKVSLLGSHEKLRWVQTNDGLIVTLPKIKPGDYVYALKIEGLDVAASNPALPSSVVRATDDGSITLSARSAVLGDGMQLQHDPIPNIGYWNNPHAAVSWQVDFQKAGTYAVEARVSAGNGATSFVIDAQSGPSAAVAVPQSASFDTYETISGATLNVSSVGLHTVTLRAADIGNWSPMNIATLVLRPSD